MSGCVGLSGAADLASAGLAALAEARWRAAKSPPRELVERSLQAIEANQTLNASTFVRAQAALTRPTRPTGLAAGERAPLLGVPRDQGRHRFRRRDDRRSAAPAPSAKRDDSEVVRWRFCCRRGDRRQDRRRRARPMADHRGPRLRRHAQPVGPRALPGGSSRRLGRGGGRGPGRGALGSDGPARSGSRRPGPSVGIKPQRGRISTWPDPELFNGRTCTARSRAPSPTPRCCSTPPPATTPATGTPPAATGRARTSLRPADRARTAADRALDSCRRSAVFPRQPLDPDVRGRPRHPIGGRAGRPSATRSSKTTHPRYGAIGTTFLPRSLAGLNDWVRRVPDPALLDPRTRANARNGRAVPKARRLPAPGPWRRRCNGRVGAIFTRVDVVLAPDDGPAAHAGRGHGRGIAVRAPTGVIIGALPVHLAVQTCWGGPASTSRRD